MNVLKTTMLLAALTAIFMGVGYLIGGEGGAVIALVAAAVLNLVSFWNADRIVLRMHRAVEVDARSAPEYHAIVRRLSERAGLPMPKLYLIDDPQPNAFATGRNPEKGVVAVTQGILDLLEQRELRGVLAHELAHIRNRDILVATIAAAIASAVTYVAQMISFSAFLGGSDEEEEGSGTSGLLVALVAPIAATLIQLGISRSREYLADESGAAICGDPESLARALEKLSRGAELVPPTAAQPATASLYIVNPFSGGGVARLFSTHPPMEDRVERLRALARRGTIAA